MDCYSEVLGENIECTVDHRFLRVYNLDQVDPSEDITFTVKNVFNPAETVKTGDFEFYVMNSQRVPRSLNRDVSGVQI